MVVPKVVRKTGLAFIALLAIALVGGAGYTLLNDGAASQPSPSKTKATASISEPDIKTVQPAANAPENASVESLTTPVAQGANANLIVQTNPDSTCTIAVLYKGVASKDSGLINKPSDKYGLISWSWTVASDTPVGNWPVNVTCTYRGRTAFVQGMLQVVPPSSGDIPG